MTSMQSILIGQQSGSQPPKRKMTREEKNDAWNDWLGWTYHEERISESGAMFIAGWYRVAGRQIDYSPTKINYCSDANLHLMNDSLNALWTIYEEDAPEKDRQLRSRLEVKGSHSPTRGRWAGIMKEVLSPGCDPKVTFDLLIASAEEKLNCALICIGVMNRDGTRVQPRRNYAPNLCQAVQVLSARYFRED